MPTIQFDNRAHELQPDESVLECLLRHGHSIPNSCRAGACQACLVRATDGAPPTLSNQSLKSTLAAQGYFLSCICRPETDLTVELAGAGVRVPATIASVAPLSHDVALVRIQAAAGVGHRAGQYVTLVRPDGLARSYSISSLPSADDDLLDLHVRRIAGGAFSNWLHDEARPGDAIQLQGPAGSCFYADAPAEQPLLLAGTGTGLSPLYGILQDAIHSGHTGPIWLFHGALSSRGLYLRDELQALADRHANFQYVAAVLNPGESETDDTLRTGRLEDVILATHPKLKGWRGFVCGDPGIVGTLKMKFFLAGMPSREIFARCVPAFVNAGLIRFHAVFLSQSIWFVPARLANSMKLTLHSDYSLRVLLYLAYSDGSGSEAAKWVGTQEISDSYGISKNHLVRVIQTLAEYGYVAVKTGRSGGARLAKPPAEINLGDVVRHTEQSFRIVECFDAETNTCPILPMCGLRGVLADALDAFLAKLDQYTLGDLCTPKRKVMFFDIMRPAVAAKNATGAKRTRSSQPGG